MSTRAQIIFQDGSETLMLYRHSDGCPDCCGKDLVEFVQDYKTGAMRDNISQSAGWLVVRGHVEYKGAEMPLTTFAGKVISEALPNRIGQRPDPNNGYDGWKVGAYEPTTCMHGDVEYIYIIDLQKNTLSCRQPTNAFWDKPDLKNTKPCREFKTVSFASESQGA